MKHIRNYESFKLKRKYENINEEFLGGLVDWFKGLWKNAVDSLKKIGDNPSVPDIKKWVDDNIFNPKNKNFLFKSVIDEFKKKENATNEECFMFIDNILDPQDGAMGKGKLQMLYDNLLKAFGKDNVGPLESIRYIVETIRNRAIKDYNYGGGPDFKVGEDAKIDPDKKTQDLEDNSHIPDFKKVLKDAGDDDKKRKDDVLNWVEKTLIVRLDKYASDIKDSDVVGYLKSKNINTGGDFKVGDEVVYKRDSWNDNAQKIWNEMNDNQRQNPEQEPLKKLIDDGFVAINKIGKIQGDDFLFEGANFTKKKSDILGKITQNEEAKKASEELGKIKNDPEKMKTVSDFASMLRDDSKKDQVEQIKKIISEN